MRQVLIFCAFALLCVCGAFVSDASAMELGNSIPTMTTNDDGFTIPQTYKNGLTRAEIRSMPMLERPNRLGHFIGNTARRRNARQ